MEESETRKSEENNYSARAEEIGRKCIFSRRGGGYRKFGGCLPTVFARLLFFFRNHTSDCMTEGKRRHSYLKERL